MNQLSILFLGTQMAVGGAQQVLLSQAKWFHKQGHLVYTAFFYDKENLDYQWDSKYPFPVVNLNAWRDDRNLLENGFSLIFGLIRLFLLLRKEKINVIETFTPDSNLLGLVIARLAGIPVRIASHHGVIEGRSRIFSWLHARLINSRFSDSLVVVSERVYRIAINEDGIRPEKVKIILNGIEPFDPAQITSGTREQLLIELNVRSDHFIVLAVGRLTGQKGHTYLLDVIPDVLERSPDVMFIIAGDGPLRKELEDKALHMGLKQNLRLLGTRFDIPALLSIADIFILPSISEGMPIALLEAMGMGVPIVASKLDQISAFVENGRQGLLVEPKDVKALSESILNLLENQSLREKLGQAGQALVLKYYTVDHMCRTYEQLFLRESGIDF